MPIETLTPGVDFAVFGKCELEVVSNLDILDGRIFEFDFLGSELFNRNLRITKVEVLGAAPRMQFKRFGNLEVLFFAVELFDKVLLVLVYPKGKEVHRPHTVKVDAILQLIDQILRRAGRARLPRGKF